jgi:hypothetical protein
MDEAYTPRRSNDCAIGQARPPASVLDTNSDEHLHPLDEASDLPDDPFSFSGWPSENIPDFKAFTESNNEAGRNRLVIPSPQQKAAATKIQNTHLFIIGALCNKLKIDYSARGAAKTIQGLLDEIGIKRDDGTIRAVLGKVREAVDANAD